jgi:hypothetical protein
MGMKSLSRSFLLTATALSFLVGCDQAPEAGSGADIADQAVALAKKDEKPAPKPAPEKEPQPKDPLSGEKPKPAEPKPIDGDGISCGKVADVQGLACTLCGKRTGEVTEITCGLPGGAPALECHDEKGPWALVCKTCEDAKGNKVFVHCLPPQVAGPGPKDPVKPAPKDPVKPESKDPVVVDPAKPAPVFTGCRQEKDKQYGECKVCYDAKGALQDRYCGAAGGPCNGTTLETGAGGLACTVCRDKGGKAIGESCGRPATPTPQKCEEGIKDEDGLLCRECVDEKGNVSRTCNSAEKPVGAQTCAEGPGAGKLVCGKVCRDETGRIVGKTCFSPR